MLVFCALYLTAQDTQRFSQTQDREPKQILACTIGDGFTLAAVGDVLVPRPASMTKDKEFKGAVGILGSADVAFGNLEGNIIDIRHFKGYPYGDSGDVWLTGAPELAGDLKDMGFRLLSRANNHTTDWGVEGMHETDRRLDEVGLIHAGTGETRAASRAARFLDSPKGRIGLVSMASTFNTASMAMAPQGEAPGRPGLNALRTKPYALVTSEMMQALHKIREAQPQGSIEPTFEEQKPGELDLFGTHYRIANHTGFSFEINQTDLREILQAIRQGKENSDFLIATIHAHEPGNWSEEPADFLPVLARLAIDSGADVFIGHGPHQLRGIEIYKGKPIFYSLGNFFYQDQLQQPMAGDLYESSGFDPSTTTDAELGAKFVNLLFNTPIWYESVIAVSDFEGGTVSEIRLYPIELGFTMRNADKGIPRRASPTQSRTILKRLQRLSQTYGTLIDIEQDIGVIRVAKEQGNAK